MRDSVYSALSVLKQNEEFKPLMDTDESRSQRE
jgi:hypothetical protein